MNRYWLIVVLAVAVSGGLLGRPAQREQSPQDDTQFLHERWQSFQVAHYRYSLTVLCQCGLTNQPYTLEVRDGQLISATDAMGQPISDTDIDAPPHSVDWFFGLTRIDSLFDHIHDLSSRAPSVNIVYDPQYAFPAYTFVNWQDGQPEAEIALHVFDFQILP